MCAEVIQGAVATLETATTNGLATPLLKDDIGELLGRVSESLADLGLVDCDSPDLLTQLEISREAEQTIRNGATAFATLSSLLGCALEFDYRPVEVLWHGLQLLQMAPEKAMDLRSPELSEEGAQRTIDRAVARSATLKQQMLLLEKTYALDVAADLGSAHLQASATEIANAGWLARFFGRKYRSACNTFRAIVLSQAKVSREAMTRDLRAIADLFRNVNQFSHDAACQRLLGTAFKGIETDWQDVQDIVRWNQEVLALLSSNGAEATLVRNVLLTERGQRLKSIKAAIAHQPLAMEGLRRLLELLADSFSAAHSTIDGLRIALDSKGRCIDDALSVIALADLKPEIRIRSVDQLVSAGRRYRESSALLESKVHAREVLGEPYGDMGGDLAPVKATLRFADAIANESLPKSATEWLLTDDYAARLSQLREWLEAAGAIAERLRHSLDEMRAVAPTATLVGQENGPLEAPMQSVSRALEAHDRLAEWQHFLRLRVESANAHLIKLTNLADEGQIEPQQLVPAFRFALYNTLTKQAFADNPELISFSGTTLDETKKQYAQLDSQAIKLYQQRVAAGLDRKVIPTGQHTGPVKGYTELSLITHETTKQKRHIPIRQLVLRAGSALQAMKPCFMMGPLSVAQYLAPGKLTFDLVIMDEASQLKPEDALGAIARGGQVVIVGDPKQLPPTSFFQRVALEDEGLTEDDDERTAIEESESILDVASTLFQPVRRLRWHYRSRHHSLIAFSNREFYDGNLIIFPSAFHESPDLGVKYRSVPTGMFIERRNTPEALAIVDAILSHMEHRPHESLGVVALNFEQRELIEDLLDRRLRLEVFARAYYERTATGSEPLFIKNLENVQGDERDVIFISGTYGPDAKGNQFQRFGPINGPNGHRRLNVLFTRARKRTEVFSSIDPDNIQVSATSSRGLRAFKQYLTYAKTGILEGATETSAEPANDFEKSVGAVLKDKGFEVIPQVGVAGFFIDLAIRHPMKAGTYLLGVECDGASYHSGRSARDRDRLRQEILVSQGWQIYRIWSTDWFSSRSGEVSRLLQRIDELLKSDPDYVRETTKRKLVESLRSQLGKLRDEDIAVSFPDSLADAGLLRPAMFEAFLSRRPRNKSDWFRLIPEDLRSQTEGKQISTYLGRVLEIIASSIE